MRQLRADVWLLQLGYRAPLDANAYLIDDRIDPVTGERRDDGDVSDGAGRGEVTLVDTGVRYNRRSLREELAAAGYEPGDVDRVLLTHYDLDHTGGLDRIDFDCPVYLGERDVWMVRGQWDPPLAHHKGLWHRAARWVFPVPDDLDLRPVRDGERVGRFTAYHTPGHNPGHTAYVHDAGVAFVGDLLWETDGELTTPFWADSYDMRLLRKSVVDFARRTDDFDLICMGHGEPFVADGARRVRALADRFDGTVTTPADD